MFHLIITNERGFLMTKFSILSQNIFIKMSIFKFEPKIDS